MSSRATEKIMEALSQLLEGFAELQDSIDSDLDEETEGVVVEDVETDDDEEGVSNDPERKVLKQLKSAIEAVIETDDFAPEEVANLIAALTEALEEVDPNIFSDDDSEEEEEEDDDEEEDLDDEDLDFDDEELDDDLDEEDDETEEEEDEAPAPKGRTGKGKR